MLLGSWFFKLIKKWIVSNTIAILAGEREGNTLTGSKISTENALSPEKDFHQKEKLNGKRQGYDLVWFLSSVPNSRVEPPVMIHDAKILPRNLTL